MDDWFRASGLREKDFVPASLSLCRVNGGLYAMPFLIDDSALLWNKNTFRQAGLNPERPPQTLEEFEQYVKKLTKKDASGRLTQLGLLPPDDIYVINRLFGGSLYDPKTGQITPDSPENVEALGWYTKFIGSMGPWEEVNAFKSGFGNNQSANNPFYTGQIAMMISGEWNPYWVKRYAPQVEYGVAPLPHPESHPERARTTWLGGNMFCIPRGSAHPKEAWDFLVWAQTDEAQVLFARLRNGVPNRRSVLNDPVLRTGEPYKVKYGVFLDLADGPNAGAFPNLPVANLYNSELLTARDLALSGEKTPALALRDVRIRVQRELDRYGRN
jgi:multiple sugar transport system substrate-binding protein